MGARPGRPLFIRLLTAATLTLFSVVALPVSAAPGVLVNSSHAGAVTDLQYDARRRLLFSAGDDGAVRVWSRNDGTIVQHLRLGVLPVERMALHPERTLLAAVLRSDTGGFLIEVWDWRAGHRLFRHTPTEAPLHLDFTSRGSSLVYTKAQFDSVVFLDAATGEPQHRLRFGFGIVSFVTTSTNERTIMTYQPTGRIRYWDAATASLQSEVTAPPGLEQIAISADRRLLVARSGAEIVTIDVVTGRVRGRVSAPGHVVFAVSDQVPRLALLETAAQAPGGGVLLRHLRLDRGLSEQARTRIDLAGAATVATYAGYSVFMADQGSIVEHRSTGARTFARNELLPVVDLVVAGNTLVAATSERIALARLSFPAAPAQVPPVTRPAAGSTPPPAPSLRLPTAVTMRRLPNPFVAPVGLTVVPAPATTASTLGNLPSVPPVPAQQLSRRPVLVWNREGEGGALGTLDPLTGAFRLRLTGLQAPLLQVSVLDHRLLLLDRSGAIRLYSLEHVISADAEVPLAPLQRFWAPGASKVVGVGERLIAGRSSASVITTPLLQINPATAETLLLADDALFIYDLARHASGHFLTLGVEAADSPAGQPGTRTVLKQHGGSSWDYHRSLHTYAGEDLFAALVTAPDGQRVYSSLGLDTVRMWDGRRLLRLERSGHRPRQLTVADNLLLARNTDGTISVWDRHTRAFLFDLYLFRGFEWLVVEPGGRYTHSYGAARYLNTAGAGS